MARSRNIKPGFFRNEELVELPFETRLLFIGLWTLADRDGRLELRPKKIKLEIFPADEVDVSLELSRLARAGLVRAYTSQGKAYLEVSNFKKHQNPHHREPSNDFPGPDEDLSQPFEFEGTSESPGQPGQNVAGPADSLLLIPDSGFPHPGPVEPEEGATDPEQKQEQTEPPPKAPTKKPTKGYELPKVNGQYQYPEEFNRLWEKYPKRPAGDDKREAFNAFNARIKEGASLEEIDAGIDRYLAYLIAKDTLGTDYIKRGSTFFGPGKWYEKPWDPGRMPVNGNSYHPPRDLSREQRDAEIDRFLAEQGIGVGVTYEHE